MSEELQSVAKSGWCITDCRKPTAPHPKCPTPFKSQFTNRTITCPCKCHGLA